MENAPSTLTSRHVHSKSPFNQFRDPFLKRENGSIHTSTSQGDPWSPGDNITNANSPLDLTGNDIGLERDMDVGMDISVSTHNGSGSATPGGHESKKKRFVCPHCTRTFARSGHLQRHERSRTLPPPIQCSFVFGGVRTVVDVFCRYE